MIVYEYPACSTCKKALQWLNAQQIAYTKRHIVDTPPSEAVLRDAIARSGLPIRRFFNTSGQSYRQGGFSERLPTMSDDEAIAALATDGKLIKRPLVIANDGATVLVGFKEDEWNAALKG